MKIASLLMLGCLWSAIAYPAQAAEKPNIIFIMADDIGYGDLSCQGARHASTPNLDKLASDGMRFLDAHSPAATCTPSRRALLTGVYSWRQQPGSTIAPGDAPLSISTNTTTIASLAKSAGYRTGVVGKWHIGLGPEGGPDWNGVIKPGPLDLGFDYAFIMAATGDRVPTVYIENDKVVNLDPNDPIKVDYKQKIGSEPTGAENPELLKLKHTHGHDMTIVNGVGRIGWMTGGHAARWVDEDMSDTFVKQATQFIETSKADKKPFLLYFATHGIHVPRVPHARFKGSSPSGTRGDAIQELDDAVGQVLAVLDKHQLTENTLVIFTSDNGGVMDDGYEDVGSFDYHPNAPLAGYKGGLYEGGHRVPFIARWPARIKAGSTSESLITHLDMAATISAIAGVSIPKGQCLDSISFLPILTSEQNTIQPSRETFIVHSGGIKGPFAVRLNNWKFIEAGGRSRYGKAAEKEKAEPRLFDLSKDLSEENNIIDQHPDIADRMRGILISEGARQTQSKPAEKK